jgi:hypothetical protein
MFPTLNIFVMIAGRKKWYTCPPQPGDQLRDYQKLFPTSSGREAAGDDLESDIVYIEPGDVLLNPPFEWHKVLNDVGFTLGGAFRVIDTDYIAALGTRGNLDASRVDVENDEEMAHFMTSLNYASRHITRAQMMLNDIEYAYLRKKAPRQTIEIGHQ